MASTDDKAVSADVASAAHSTDDVAVELPKGWKYKAPKWAKNYYYASPEVQLLLVAITCFLCPGMFNALNGLGGGGLLGTFVSTSDHTNEALYATFSVVGFFAGSIANTLGIKLALAFGGLGYSVYVAAYLCFNHTQNSGFMIFSGFLLGCCAGVLWAAQGAIMMSYPHENQKGRYISWFWIIFNLGGVIGSLVPLGENLHTATDGGVNDGTYIGFLVLTFLGACMACSLVNAKDVVRSDGTRIILMKNPTWKTELWGLVETFKSDPYIVLMFPMFISSNWFYTYQFNGVNLAKFTLRTRALNNTLYWLAQIVGATIFGFALDLHKYKRTTRAKALWVVLMVFTMALWGGGYVFQRDYTRSDVYLADGTTNPDFDRYDWTTPGYVGPMFLMIFYGLYDAAWQTAVYWFMGALTNNSRKLANFAGFYKGIQSAGSAITWSMDAHNVPYMTEFAVCWALLAGSLIIAAPIMIWKIKDTVPLEEDLKFSDETVEDVLGTKATAHEGGLSSSVDLEKAS